MKHKKPTIHNAGSSAKTIESQSQLIEELQQRLSEAMETIEAIQTGQVDALVVQGEAGHQLYTLKSADQTYRVFIEKMTEGAVTLSREGVILYCNSQFATMVKRDLSEIIGSSFLSYVSEESLAEYRDLFERCWSTDCKAEMLISSGSGNTRVQLSLATLQLEEGVALSVIITDLTDLKATQEKLRINNKQLEEANKALQLSNHELQQFAYAASHDMKEPVRKLHLFVDRLRERMTGKLDADEIYYFDRMQSSAKRMGMLIDDLLMYSHIRRGADSVEDVDLNTVIALILDDLEVMIEEKGAIFSIGKLPVLRGHKLQLQQLFQNLISNSLKYNEPGNKLEITISSSRVNGTDPQNHFDSGNNMEYHLIEVSDNGIGFEQEDAERIFDVFTRLHGNEFYKGTGVGLSIARQVVENHNGRIMATSIPGEGASFRVYLPVS